MTMLNNPRLYHTGFLQEKILKIVKPIENPKILYFGLIFADDFPKSDNVEQYSDLSNIKGGKKFDYIIWDNSFLSGNERSKTDIIEILPKYLTENGILQLPVAVNPMESLLRPFLDFIYYNTDIGTKESLPDLLSYYISQHIEIEKPHLKLREYIVDNYLLNDDIGQDELFKTLIAEKTYYLSDLQKTFFDKGDYKIISSVESILEKTEIIKSLHKTDYSDADIIYAIEDLHINEIMRNDILFITDKTNPVNYKNLY